MTLDGAHNDTPGRVYLGGFDMTLYMNRVFGFSWVQSLRVSALSFTMVFRLFQVHCSLPRRNGAFPQ